jgi:hypothetical protein
MLRFHTRAYLARAPVNAAFAREVGAVLRAAC